MYALCASGTVNTQGFVWKFYMCLIEISIHLYEKSFEMCHKLLMTECGCSEGTLCACLTGC